MRREDTADFLHGKGDRKARPVVGAPVTDAWCCPRRVRGWRTPRTPPDGGHAPPGRAKECSDV